MGLPRFIDLKKYLSHTAVWEVTTVSTWGDSTDISTSVSVACLYYTGNILRDLNRSSQGVARAIEGVELEHYVLLYSTPTVKVGDLLCTITNQDAETMIGQARITKVEAFSGWNTGRGKLLQQVTVEFN